MVRLRLTSVVVAVIALSGAWAMPARQLESTRLVTSITCPCEDAARQEVRSAGWHRTPPEDGLGLRPLRPAPAARTTPLPHALYQRPPPGH